jgi:hypothetical protein
LTATGTFLKHSASQLLTPRIEWEAIRSGYTRSRTGSHKKRCATGHEGVAAVVESLKLRAKWIVLRSKMSLHIPRLAPGLWNLGGA